MTPRTSGQLEKIREKRRRQIMETGLELFAELGYSSTSISRIAQKASISKGLMYNYFSSKEELLVTIIDNGIGEMFKTFDPDKDGVLTAAEFEFFIGELFELLSERRQFYRLYFTLMMQPDVWKLFEEKISTVISTMLQLLSDYYNRKGVEKPEMEALLVGAVFDGVSFNYLLNPELFPLDDIKKLIIKKFV